MGIDAETGARRVMRRAVQFFSGGAAPLIAATRTPRRDDT
jgi:hypothetical protein